MKKLESVTPTLLLSFLTAFLSFLRKQESSVVVLRTQGKVKTLDSRLKMSGMTD